MEQNVIDIRNAFRKLVVFDRFVDILKLSVFVFSFRFMVFNTTFKNISFFSWRSVLLVEKIRVPRENHWPSVSHWQTLSYYKISASPWSGFELTTLVVIGTDCIGSCKSNYHMITTTTIPICFQFIKWININDSKSQICAVK